MADELVEAVARRTAGLLTAVDLAERWQVRPQHVYRLTREGHLPTVRLGRYYRYRLAAVEELEAAGGVPADASSARRT